MQHTGDAVEVAQQATDVLLQTLPTLADDAEEDAVLDALHARSCTCILRVIPIARQSGTIPLSPPV